MNNQIIRKIAGGFQSNFQMVESSLIINVTHPNKSQVFFGRITDQHMPQNLTQISDNTKQLYQFISELDGQKIAMNSNNELVIFVGIGKKVKEYSIPLEKVDISSEESLKKEVNDLKAQLERKNFEINFYKQQYHYLLNFLQLSPNSEELERFYKKDISSVLYPQQAKMYKSQSMPQKSQVYSVSTGSSISNKSAKVGSMLKIQKEELKCLNNHLLISQPTTHPSYKCNICRKYINLRELRYHCRPCDFDVCNNCISIPPQNRLYCPKQHCMNFGIAPTYLTRFCDKCKKSLAFTKGYTCIECDADLCKSCSQ